MCLGGGSWRRAQWKSAIGGWWYNGTLGCNRMCWALHSGKLRCAGMLEDTMGIWDVMGFEGHNRKFGMWGHKLEVNLTE